MQYHKQSMSKAIRTFIVNECRTVVLALLVGAIIGIGLTQ